MDLGKPTAEDIIYTTSRWIYVLKSMGVLQWKSRKDQARSEPVEAKVLRYAATVLVREGQEVVALAMQRNAAKAITSGEESSASATVNTCETSEEDDDTGTRYGAHNGHNRKGVDEERAIEEAIEAAGGPVSYYAQKVAHKQVPCFADHVAIVCLLLRAYRTKAQDHRHLYDYIVLASLEKLNARLSTAKRVLASQLENSDDLRQDMAYAANDRQFTVAEFRDFLSRCNRHITRITESYDALTKLLTDHANKHSKKKAQCEVYDEISTSLTSLRDALASFESDLRTVPALDRNAIKHFFVRDDSIGGEEDDDDDDAISRTKTDQIATNALDIGADDAADPNVNKRVNGDKDPRAGDRIFKAIVDCTLHIECMRNLLSYADKPAFRRLVSNKSIEILSGDGQKATYIGPKKFLGYLNTKWNSVKGSMIVDNLDALLTSGGLRDLQVNQQGPPHCEAIICARAMKDGKPYYIGISKRCCLVCSILLEFSRKYGGTLLFMPGTSGRVWPTSVQGFDEPLEDEVAKTLIQELLEMIDEQALKVKVQAGVESCGSDQGSGAEAPAPISPGRAAKWKT